MAIERIDNGDGTATRLSRKHKMKDWTSKTGDARILHGSCLERLRDLLEGSVQCCVTSPPYWGLRDYGHSNQLGLEPTPEAYVANMVAVFCEVRRVLRDDGVLFLNLGDSYAGGTLGRNDQNRPNGQGVIQQTTAKPELYKSQQRDVPQGLKPKDLVGIPWRVAFALQSDGWWLRQDIIWHKPNPMPESVTDRCTKAHEYIFLLTKSARYFYDSEAVKEGAIHAGKVVTLGEKSLSKGQANVIGVKPSGNGAADSVTVSSLRNRRSVWTVSTKPYSGAHFATYPPDLIEPCILAGTSERGRCRACGAAWERVVETVPVPRREKPIGYDYGGVHNNPTSNMRRPNGQEVAAHKAANPDKTIGWQPTCQCSAGDPIPCIVLDPFNGSGTTGEVCIKHGRHYVGCELNQDYIELAKKRLQAAARSYGMPLFDTATT